LSLAYRNWYGASSESVGFIGSSLSSLTVRKHVCPEMCSTRTPAGLRNAGVS